MAELTDEGAQTSKDPVHLLLEVQERDLSIDQIAYRRRELDERKAVAELDSRIAALQTRAAGVRSRFDELSKAQGELEQKISGYTSRMAAIDARLTQGGAYREIQAMSEESQSLARHKTELEDEELELMEEIEPVEKELTQITEELAKLRAEREATAVALSEKEAALDAEVAEVHRARDELASGLPSDLAATYERLREHLGGIGAARLIDGACSGCHLHLPSSERERVLHAAAGEVVYCDQCGRILVA